MATDEIVLPETKPETEWIDGRPVRKVSPTREHARLQTALGIALNAWAEGRGEVATEWRFRVQPPGEIRRPLVPDVAFVRYESTRELSDEALSVPPIAPDVAIEVLSPDDRPRLVASKVDTYLRAGTALVVLVDPGTRTFVLHDHAGERRLGAEDVFTHPALPGFTLAVGPFFEDALKRRDR